jgi:hypothetical protein
MTKDEEGKLSAIQHLTASAEAGKNTNPPPQIDGNLTRKINQVP